MTCDNCVSPLECKRLGVCFSYEEDISDRGMEKWRDDAMLKIQMWADSVRMRLLFEMDRRVFEEYGVLIYRT